MRLSHPWHHLFLLRAGFSHEALGAMDEGEFMHWVDQAAALQEARAEAIRAARDK